MIEKINSNFNARYNYKNGKNYSYQIILQDNMQQLSNFILEKKQKIEFNIPLMKLHRKDNLKLKEIFLSMTPEERKRLGVNKSTLWCMQNNLKKGKSINLYDNVLSKMINEFLKNYT